MPHISTIGKTFLVRFMLLFTASVLAITASGLYPSEVKANPGPDLVVQDISLSPAEPILDDTLVITVAIKNQGTTEAGYSYAACHIGDTILTSASIQSISPGATRTTTFTWKVEAGSHTIKAVADSSGLVAEDDETNNTQTYNFTTLAPDLIIESISWTPDNPSKGDDIVFSITVKNQGNSKSAASTVHLYTDDISRGYKDIAMLNPGDTVTKTFDWIAPAGQQTIRAVADETEKVNEADENNNEKSMTFSTLAPDLIIDDITWEPENPSKNDLVTLTTTVTNQGSGRSDACHVGYYIDKEYYSAVKIGSLEGETSANITFEWTIVASEFEFKAVVDLYNDVEEVEEKNNDKKVNVFTISPDLTVTGISWTPEDPAVGDTIAYTITVKNQGSGDAGASHMSYFIGGVHSGYVNVPPLTAGAETSVPLEYECPLDTLAVDIKVAVDYDNRITETIEYNNSESRMITLLLPDITVPAITWYPENPTVGETATFTVTINNQGEGKAGIFHVGYYIDDVFLDSDTIYTAELSTSINKTCTWKSQMGLHTFKAIADYNRVITESNEDNNTVSVTVIPNMPDLFISNTTWSPLEFNTGEEITFSVSVKNRGGAVAAPCRLVCYVDDVASGYQDIAQVGPGITVSKDFVWMSTEGSHTIELVIDTNDTVNEFDETNNSRTVLLPPPDLTIQELTWSPSDAGVGDNVTLTATVTNQGSGEARVNQLTFYVDGMIVATVDLPKIAAGQTVSRSCEWTVEAVKHYLRIYVDEGNQITESDETNNEKEIVFSPRSADLICESVSWAMENALIDNEVSFNITIKNQGNYRAEPSNLTYFIDGLLIESQEIEAIEPGETTTILLVKTVEAGLHTFGILVDPEDIVAENDETNNEMELPFSTMAPDLMVKNITFSPLTAVAGDTITITVKLENRGRDTAKNPSLDLRINGNSLGSVDIEEITVGDIITQDYTWIAEEGTHEFSAFIDLKEIILENNEDNNVTLKTFTFSPPKKPVKIALDTPSTGSKTSGLLADSWLMIIAAAALLGGLSFYIAFKAFRKE